MPAPCYVKPGKVALYPRAIHARRLELDLPAGTIAATVATLARARGADLTVDHEIARLRGATKRARGMVVPEAIGELYALALGVELESITWPDSRPYAEYEALKAKREAQADA